MGVIPLEAVRRSAIPARAFPRRRQLPPYGQLGLTAPVRFQQVIHVFCTDQFGLSLSCVNMEVLAKEGVPSWRRIYFPNSGLIRPDHKSLLGKRLHAFALGFASLDSPGAPGLARVLLEFASNWGGNTSGGLELSTGCPQGAESGFLLWIGYVRP